MTEPNGNGKKDPRIDKFVGWLLATLVTVAFSVFAYEFGNLRDSIQSLEAKVDSIGTRTNSLEARLPVIETTLIQLRSEQTASTPRIYSVDVLAKEVAVISEELRRLRDHVEKKP